MLIFSLFYHAMGFQLLLSFSSFQKCSGSAFFLQGGMDKKPPAVFVALSREGGLIEWRGITEEEQAKARGSSCHDSEQFVNFFRPPHHHYPQHIVFIIC